MARKSFRETVFGAEEHSAAKMGQEKLNRFQNIATRMFHTPVLSAKEIGIPAISRAGRQISEMINDTYRTFYFVSVLRLDMVYVVLIGTLLGVYNTLIRPLMGIAYDKTRTRWGKARPYTVFGPLFYYGATALMFCARLFIDNDITDDPRKILFVFITMMIRDTFSLIYKLPLDSYLSLMTPNPKDRMSVGLWQTYAYKWSGDFLAAMLMPLLDMARSGWIKVSPAVIFATFGIIAAFIGTGGGLLLSLTCRERIMLQPTPAPTSKSLFYILKNKYAMRGFFLGLAGSWWSKGGYPWDVVQQLEIFGGVIRTFPWYMPRQIMQIVSLSLVEPFKRMFGGNYRKTVMFMRIWDMFFGSCAGALGMLWPKQIVGTWWKAGLIFAIFDGLIVSNDAPSDIMEAELGRRASDYTEYVTGERPDGTFGLITMFAGKITDPLRALTTIAVFRWTGYDSNIAANKPWSQDRVRENITMYSKVFLLENFSDLVPWLLNFIYLVFFDLEGKKMEDMYTALNERRALIAKESAMSEEVAAMVEILAEGG